MPADTAPERLAVQPEAGLVSQRITEPVPDPEKEIATADVAASPTAIVRTAANE